VLLEGGAEAAKIRQKYGITSIASNYGEQERIII